MGDFRLPQDEFMGQEKGHFISRSHLIYRVEVQVNNMYHHLFTQSLPIQFRMCMEFWGNSRKKAKKQKKQKKAKK